MKLLLDTQLLLWAAGQPERFSAAQTATERSRERAVLQPGQSLGDHHQDHLGRDDFRVEPRVLRRSLLDNGYVELPVTSEHAVNVAPQDPFDRLLLAQALVEGTPFSPPTSNWPTTAAGPEGLTTAPALPSVHIGVAQYEDAPTGATVF